MLNSPKLQTITVGESGQTVDIACPPNVLAHLDIQYTGSGPVYFCGAGVEVSHAVSTEHGTVEVPVNDKAEIEVWTEYGRGTLMIYVMAWTAAGQ